MSGIHVGPHKKDMTEGWSCPLCNNCPCYRVPTRNIAFQPIDCELPIRYSVVAASHVVSRWVRCALTQTASIQVIRGAARAHCRPQWVTGQSETSWYSCCCCRICLLCCRLWLLISDSWLSHRLFYYQTIMWSVPNETHSSDVSVFNINSFDNKNNEFFYSAVYSTSESLITIIPAEFSMTFFFIQFKVSLQRERERELNEISRAGWIAISYRIININLHSIKLTS